MIVALISELRVCCCHVSSSGDLSTCVQYLMMSADVRAINIQVHRWPLITDHTGDTLRSQVSTLRGHSLMIIIINTWRNNSWVVLQFRGNSIFDERNNKLSSPALEASEHFTFNIFINFSRQSLVIKINIMNCYDMFDDDIIKNKSQICQIPVSGDIYIITR